MTNNIKKYWDEFHNTQNEGALTGTLFKDVVNYFGFRPDIKKGLKILNIGVGLGKCTKGYFDAGCEVYALDISEKALHRVSKWIKEGFLHEECAQLPDNKFDLAVSYLVTQHMSDEDIIFQFTNVIRSLKPNGRLFVQFAGSDNEEENNVPDTIVGTLEDGELGVVSMLGGRMVRTPDYAKKLIEQCGGYVFYTSKLKRFPKYKSYWYYLEVRRP